MGRKNPRRRLLAKQAILAAPLKQLRSSLSDTENAALQRGSPRVTSATRFDRVIGKATPLRPPNWEGTGKVKPADVKKQPVRVRKPSKAKDRAELPGLVEEYLLRGGTIS
jgi:hypothetical protein